MSSARGRPAAGDSQAGYPPEASYPPQAGYPQQGGYPSQSGYPQAAYQQEQGYPAGQYESRQVTYTGGGGAKAGSVLAGVLMILAGVITFLDGLGMVTKHAFYTFHSTYAYHWTTTNWGWTQLILGGVVFLAGVCVMLGMVWARIVGVVLATLSAVSSFLVLPYYPVWSIILIAVDVFVIWALVSRGKHVSRA